MQLAKPLSALRSMILSRIGHVVRPIQNIWMLWFGFDVFIAYKQQDARLYVDTLAKILSSKHNLEVYVDHMRAPGGVAIRKDIRRDLLRSQALLVVASPMAIAEHDEITAEIDEFRRNRPDRRVMAIEFSDELKSLDSQHPWTPCFGKSFEQRLWCTEDGGMAALLAGEPDSSTVDYLIKSRDRIRRRVIAVISGAVTATLVGALVFSTSVYVYRFIDSSIQIRAISMGFEALDRADFNAAKAMVLVRRSLELRDNYAARRALMTLWAEVPYISRIGYQTVFNIDSFVTTDETALLKSESTFTASNGWEVVSFNEDFTRSHTDSINWGAAYGSNAFHPVNAAVSRSGQVAVVVQNDAEQQWIDLYAGKVSPHEDNQPARLSCLARYASTADYPEIQLNWVDNLTDLDGRIVHSLLLGVVGKNKPLLWDTDDRSVLELAVQQPEKLQKLSRINGGSCLIAAGKDWSEGEHASLSLLDADQASQDNMPMESTPLGIDGTYDTNTRNMSLLTHASLQVVGGSILAVGIELAGADNGKSGRYFVDLYRTDTFERIARIKTRSNNLVRLLPPPEHKTQSPVLLAVGSWNGTLQVYSVVSDGNELATTPLLDAFVQRDQSFAGDGHYFNSDAALWKNFQNPVAVFRSGADRVAWIDRESQYIETQLNPETPRFGKKIDPSQALPVQRISNAYQTVKGRIPWGIGRWLPLDLLQWTVNSEEIRLGPPGWFDWQDGRRQPVVDPTGDGIWYIEPRRKGRPLVYQGFGFDGFQDLIDIVYWANEPLIHDRVRNDILVLTGRSIKRIGLDRAKVDFWDLSGTFLGITLSGVAQTAALVPGLPYIFVVVRDGNDLGFELVDLERNLSLSRMVKLGEVASDAFEWPNGDRCFHDVSDVEVCPVQVKIDEKSLLATIAFGGREQFKVALSIDDWLADIERTLRWAANGELARELGVEPGSGVPLLHESTSNMLVDVCTEKDIFSLSTWKKIDIATRRAYFPASAEGCPVLQ